MPQSFARVVLHTTFSTKYRRPLITSEIEPRLLKYIVGILKRFGSHTIRINAVEDHVHIVHTLPRTVSIADLLKEVKTQSSHFVKDTFDGYDHFYWQGGYGTFSVDYRRIDGLLDYVDNQKQHHNSKLPEHDFAHEFRRMLRAYGLEFDEKYLFPEDPLSSG